MFARVEHEQGDLRFQDAGERIERRIAHRNLRSEGRADGLCEQSRVGERSEVHVPDAVVEAILDLRGDRDGDARLTDAADAGDSDQTMRIEETAQFGFFGGAPDQRCKLDGQISAR